MLQQIIAADGTASNLYDFYDARSCLVTAVEVGCQLISVLVDKLLCREHDTRKQST